MSICSFITMNHATFFRLVECPRNYWYLFMQIYYKNENGTYPSWQDQNKEIYQREPKFEDWNSKLINVKNDTHFCRWIWPISLLSKNTAVVHYRRPKRFVFGIIDIRDLLVKVTVYNKDVSQNESSQNIKAIINWTDFSIIN